MVLNKLLKKLALSVRESDLLIRFLVLVPMDGGRMELIPLWDGHTMLLRLLVTNNRISAVFLTVSASFQARNAICVDVPPS